MAPLGVWLGFMHPYLYPEKHALRFAPRCKYLPPISYLWQCTGVITQVMESISLSLDSLGLVSDNVQSIFEVQESQVIFFYKRQD